MKKILIIFLLFLGLFFSSQKIFAAYSYTREPSNFYIKNPVIISVHSDNPTEDICSFVNADPVYLQLQIYAMNNGVGFVSPVQEHSPEANPVDISYDFILPDDNYYQVGVYCSPTNNVNEWGGLQDGGLVNLEGGGIDTIFSFLRIINLPMASSSEITGFGGNLFISLWMLITLAIGIPLGFYIIKGAISLLQRKK